MRTPGLVLLMLLACASKTDEALVLGDRLIELREGGLVAEMFEARVGARRLYVIRAEIPATTEFRVRAHPKPAPLQDIVGSGPLIAINGGFYDENGRALGLVIEDGKTVSKLLKRGGSGVLVRDAAGFHIVHRDRVPATELQQALQSIDRVVGDAASLVGDKASPALDARSAVASFKDRSARLYAVFSREAIRSTSCDESGCVFTLSSASSTSGVSLRELADFLVAEGAQGALNLDGGYSTGFEARLSNRQLRVVAFGATINALVARP